MDMLTLVFPSKSDPARHYTVRARADDHALLCCDCPHYSYRKTPCAHMREAEWRLLFWRLRHPEQSAAVQRAIAPLMRGPARPTIFRGSAHAPTRHLPHASADMAS